MVEFKMHIFKLTVDIKKQVQTQVKQKFYRDKLYYWNISQNDTRSICVCDVIDSSVAKTANTSNITFTTKVINSNMFL